MDSHEFPIVINTTGCRIQRLYSKCSSTDNSDPEKSNKTNAFNAIVGTG
jgi:hypothetical protein